MKLTYISKDTSLCLKGFALFLMVFLHLFNQEANIKDCFRLFSVQGVPLANFLSRGCNPVGLYLFVSGYGLYYLHKKRSGGGKYRLLRLYIIYWVALLPFVGIGCVLKPDVYPGTWKDVVANVTAYRTGYYGEAWFLFPYILLSLTSGWVFNVLDRWGVRIVYPVAFVLNYMAMYAVSRYYVAYFDSHYAVYHVVLYFDCLLPFLTGALFSKYADYEFVGRWTCKAMKCQPLILAALALLFLVNCLIHSAAFSPIYLPLFILLFIRVEWGGMLTSCLRFLGRFSTVVWLVHTWFCYYLFKDFVYGFHYPLLILAVEFALSIASGYVVMRIADGVSKVIWSK